MNHAVVLPDFLIVGAMKCATSTLHDQLALQADIHMSEPKEPNFFSDDDQYAKGLAWYSSLFDPTATWNGESSTHYTKMPTYPETLKRMQSAGIKDQKLIYMVRHPIDRLVSHYIHEWSQGIYHCDINTAVTRYPELIAYSSYAMQLEHILSMFPAENILLVFFEHLKDHPQEELESVAAHIGYTKSVQWDFEKKASNVSAQRIRKFPLYHLLIESRLMQALRRTLIPQGLRDKVKNKLTMKERPQLNEDSIKLLEAKFDEDLRKLGAMVNLDLGIANYKSVASTTLSRSLGKAEEYDSAECRIG